MECDAFLLCCRQKNVITLLFFYFGSWLLMAYQTQDANIKTVGNTCTLHIWNSWGLASWCFWVHLFEMHCGQVSIVFVGADVSDLHPAQSDIKNYHSRSSNKCTTFKFVVRMNEWKKIHFNLFHILGLKWYIIRHYSEYLLHSLYECRQGTHRVALGQTVI